MRPISLPVQPPGLPKLPLLLVLSGLLAPLPLGAAGLPPLPPFDAGLAWRLLGDDAPPASAATAAELPPLLLLARGFTKRYLSAAWPASSKQAAEASSGNSEGLPLPPPSSGARASARAASEPSSCPSVAPAPSSPNRRPAASGLNTSAERAHCRKKAGRAGPCEAQHALTVHKPMLHV